MKPAKIIVCKCEQCKYVKNKRKNKNTRKRVKRMLNKRRRTVEDEYIVFYWA